MSKLKDNLIMRYLPMWAKETVLADNKRLMKENSKLKRENEVLRSYMDGVKAGMMIRIAERKDNG